MSGIGEVTQLQNIKGSKARKFRFARRSDALRPPWTDEQRIRQNCTSCGDCITVCPEAILFAGPAKTPVVNFQDTGCTFCGDCAHACAKGVFRDPSETSWTLKVQISDACLLASGVSCRGCIDYCDTRALQFDLRSGPVGGIHIHLDDCTGCGACQSPCPVNAISFFHAPPTTQEVQQ